MGAEEVGLPTSTAARSTEDEVTARRGDRGRNDFESCAEPASSVASVSSWPRAQAHPRGAMESERVEPECDDRRDIQDVG